MTVFVDGLDEIHQLDPKFPALLTELLHPGLTIVASSRDEAFLHNMGSKEQVERIAFASGRSELQGLGDDDICALLIDGLGRRARELVALDADTEDGGGTRNPYIERVVRRAAGKPLYVELLVSEIAHKRAPIDPDVRLPASMEAFYDKVLAREGVSDAKAHLALMLCLSALLEEPVGRGVFADILLLSPYGAPRRVDPADWVRNALIQGNMLFTRTAMPDDDDALTLYHQELRRYIRGEAVQGAPALSWAFGLAKWLLARAAMRYGGGIETPTGRHFTRFGALYLMDHADGAQPAVLDGRAAEMVGVRYFDVEALVRTFEAWADQSEDFLTATARIFRRHRQSAPDLPAAPLLEAMAWLVTGRPELNLTAPTVHSVYSYSPDDAPLYRGMVDIILSDAFAAQVGDTPEAQLPVANWISVAAGLSRRAGDHRETADRFARADQVLKELKQIEGHARVSALLSYEKGYLAYFCTNLDEADAHLRESVAHARRAGNPLGERIAEIARLRFIMLGARAGCRPVAAPADALATYLDTIMPGLLQDVLTAEDEETRLGAERWVMNARANSFEAAFVKGEAEQAARLYEALLEDAWIRKVDPKQRAETLDEFARRAALIAGDTERAIELYRATLPLTDRPALPPGRQEGVAEHYLDFGNLLRDAGDVETARQAYQAGLSSDNRFANDLWKPALRAASAAIGAQTG